MKVEYIYHSGFTLETEKYFLVFDYYKGDIHLKSKKVIVFSTHGHGDHYNPVILDWKDKVQDISYVLSSDIDVNPADNIYKMDPYQVLKLHDIKVKSFGSTDLGLSLLINVEGKNIFFAGDLNWWHWEDDSKEAQLKEEEDFKNEINKIKGSSVDIAFAPVDPRLGDGYYLGGEHVIKELKPKVFFPMHFGDKCEVVPRFINKINDSNVNIVEITKQNEVFEI